MKFSRTFFAVFAAVLLAACATDPRPQEAGRGVEVTTLGGGKYFPGESPFAVGVIPNATLHDAQRNRDVVMTIEYPTRGGPYPLIVFSHAYGLSKDAYVALTEYWVGHGYVCIKPAHADAGAARQSIEAQRAEAERQDRERRERRSRSSAVEVTNVPNQPAPESAWQSQTPADWQNRARDITLILDSIDKLEQNYPELAGKIDLLRTGVGGDSYGAFTSMLLGGMTSFKTNPPLHPADARVRAIVAMSPQGVTDVFGLTAESWRDVKIPAMFVTGSGDRGLGADGDPKWRRDPFAYSPAGDKYFVSFAGVRQSTFAGTSPVISEREVRRGSDTPIPAPDPLGRPGVYPAQPAPGPPAVQTGRRSLGPIQLVTIAFWDAYLKNDANALDYLKSNAFTSMSQGGTVAERK